MAFGRQEEVSTSAFRFHRSHVGCAFQISDPRLETICAVYQAACVDRVAEPTEAAASVLIHSPLRYFGMSPVSPIARFTLGSGWADSVDDVDALPTFQCPLDGCGKIGSCWFFSSHRRDQHGVPEHAASKPVSLPRLLLTARQTILMSLSCSSTAPAMLILPRLGRNRHKEKRCPTASSGRSTPKPARCTLASTPSRTRSAFQPTAFRKIVCKLFWRFAPASMPHSSSRAALRSSSKVRPNASLCECWTCTTLMLG
jgi:hypothetical protein